MFLMANIPDGEYLWGRPAGAAGVELILAMQKRLIGLTKQFGGNNPSNFHLVTQSAELLTEFPQRLREAVLTKAKSTYA
jgi:NADH dehydrogenase FAD-containing subunit